MHSLSDINIFINNNKCLFSTPSSFFSLRPYTQVRNFSTSLNKNTELEYGSELDPDLENLTSDQRIKAITSDPELHEKIIAYEKSKSVNEFKKIYKGGFLGYNKVHHFGNVSDLPNFLDFNESNSFSLSLKEFLDEIPENKVYSVLPILRWQYLNGEYNSISITNSIKITRDTSKHMLTKK